MILNVFLIVVALKLSRCSLVHDSTSQNTLYVSSYCPEMKGCLEGTHVICQYYSHRRPFGQLCKNYVKISLSPEMANQILDGVNKIRMNLATGKETGKDGRPLPRAYGMMRMHWDSELATLAQVFADQCLGLKEDDCRATDRFPNPSQFITLINFKAPNWEYLVHNNTERGLTQEKITSSISKAIKSLHGIKHLITTDEINECPVLETLPNKGSRSYLKLVRGRATHIGCGISAYRRSQTISARSQRIYNTVQLVCNVSDGPQQTQPVYTTDPPIPDTGFTDKCGCPDGYRESMGCLCEEYNHSDLENTEIQFQQFDTSNKYDTRDIEARTHSQSHEAEPCDDPNGVCDGKPNMVMLPIFEILDAPNDPMSSYEADNDVEMQFHNRFGNSSFIQSSMEENEIINEEIYPETQTEFTKNHKNRNRHHRNYRKGITKDHREKVLRNHDKIETSYERTAEHFNHLYSMEDNVVEQEPRENSDYDDRIAVNDDQAEEENTFLNILDRLEKAVKNVELEGRKRDVVDLKMRKIYEAALKSKIQHKKIDDNESEKLEELKKLADYLKQKPEHAFADKRVHNGKLDSMINLMDRQDKETDALEKIFDILNKKHVNNNFDPKNEYRIIKPSDLPGHNENNVYNKYPSSRKQEKINRYNKNILDFNKIKSNLPPESYNGDTKKNGKIIIMDNRHKKVLGKKRKMRTFNTDQVVKKNVKRRHPYSDHKSWKTQTKPLSLRRVFETENERPTLATLPTTTPQTNQIKLNIHIRDQIHK